MWLHGAGKTNLCIKFINGSGLLRCFSKTHTDTVPKNFHLNRMLSMTHAFTCYNMSDVKPNSNLINFVPVSKEIPKDE